MAQSIAQFAVTGMTCAHCEMSVREEVGEIPGVESVDVQHETGALVVTSFSPVEDEMVLAAVSEAGYAATRV